MILDLLKEANAAGGHAGIRASKCKTDSDCYQPGEECNADWKTCVCKVPPAAYCSRDVSWSLNLSVALCLFAYVYAGFVCGFWGAGNYLDQYWSPREQHAVAVYESTFYLVGGLVSIHNSLCGDYACGDTDAGSYKKYMSDIWKSTDGEVWTRVTNEPGWSARSAHVFMFMNVR